MAWARVYLLVQAVAGALWWVGVFTIEPVRIWTLGNWNPWVLVIPDLLLFVGASALAALRSSWPVATVVAVWTGLLTLALGVYGLLERAAGWGLLLMAAATIGSVAAAATLRSGALPVSWFFVGPFRFRPAGQRSRAANTAVSLAQLLVFWTSFYVGVPVLLSAVEDRLRVRWDLIAEAPSPLVGAVLFALGTPLGLASCLTMAARGDGTPLPAQTARSLVVGGPYAYLRNPMATAGVVQSIGVGLWFGTWTMIVAAFAGALAWHLAIRPVEEADLEQRFGAEYRTYRARVRTWVPHLR